MLCQQWSRRWRRWLRCDRAPTKKREYVPKVYLVSVVGRENLAKGGQDGGPAGERVVVHEEAAGDGVCVGNCMIC